MAETLASVRTSIVNFLQDTLGEIWGSGEIENYIQEGYDELALETRCLWISAYLDDVAGTATYSLPTDLQQLDRVTWNYRRLPASRLAELQRIDRNFNIVQGQPLTFSNDGDGLLILRKYPIPSAAGSAWTVSGSYGIPRSLSDILSGVTGTYGIPRNTGDGSIGARGIPRCRSKDQTNTKVEYFKRGRALSPNQGFEIPDFYVKYVRHYALWRALERDGPGQDLKLAAHYEQRFQVGLARMMKRKEAIHRSQTLRFGGAARDRATVEHPKLPWQYGQVVRYP